MSTTAIMISPSDSPVRCINEELGDPEVFASLAEMEAAIHELDENMPNEGYWPSDGLVEGRDYEEASEEDVDLLAYARSMNPPALRGVSLSDCDPEGWMEISRISDVMDTELRERVHDESAWLHKEGHGWMSDQAFLTRYARAHREKFGKDFAPVEG